MSLVDDVRDRIVQATLRLEGATGLDPAVAAIEPAISSVFGSGERARVLRGEWLGHAVHPVLTDQVLGSWTSATVLDLIGGKSSTSAARRLVGVGLVAVAPTAWTGWAEWAAAESRDKRVGLVHAVTNGFAIAAYAASWMVRGRGQQRLGVGLALAGAAASGIGGY